MNLNAHETVLFSKFVKIYMRKNIYVYSINVQRTVNTKQVPVKVTLYLPIYTVTTPTKLTQLMMLSLTVALGDHRLKKDQDHTILWFRS